MLLIILHEHDKGLSPFCFHHHVLIVVKTVIFYVYLEESITPWYSKKLVFYPINFAELQMLATQMYMYPRRNKTIFNYTIFFCSGEELTCWSGHDTSMSKQVCSPATTTPHEETGPPNGTISDSEAGKTYCYEMMYHESGVNSTLSFQKNHVAGRLTHINASCDTELLCNSTNAWKSVQVCYNLYVSGLFCHTCTTENFRSKILL